MANAVNGEREDQLFYEFLISEAPTEEEKNIISSIRDDEMKHGQMFREIYKALTGKEIISTNGAEFVRPKTYLEGIQKALFGELRAIEKYRIIRENLQDRHQRDMLFNIITDEIKHASKYNYLFTLNRTKETRNNDMPQLQVSNSIAGQWIEYIQPLVARALAEEKMGVNLTRLFQEYILAGVLVGGGFSPHQAIRQVEAWENPSE
ncbi:ferritin-like domain-containing protein [bacterium LRH843]|nr:ferritin-like domain-containing protein [bacterium LRH843]